MTKFRFVRKDNSTRVRIQPVYRVAQLFVWFTLRPPFPHYSLVASLFCRRRRCKLHARIIALSSSRNVCVFDVIFSFRGLIMMTAPIGERVPLGI